MQLNRLIAALQERFKDRGIGAERIESVILDALNNAELEQSLCEAFRVAPDELHKALSDAGFENVVNRAQWQGAAANMPSTRESRPLTQASLQSPFPELFTIECSPPLNQPIALSAPALDALQGVARSISISAPQDSFFALYRTGAMAYHERFMKIDAPKIDAYLREHFPKGKQLQYIVSSGIGADEQYCHFMAALHNQNPQRSKTWIVVDAPSQLGRIPLDANPENTLFLEVSRSGKTQETVKTHEFTPRGLKRIVFANSGPLYELGVRDHNLVLPIPEEVPGRFGRNTTPILLAPLYVAGEDTRALWQLIEDALERFDPAHEDSVPLIIAQFMAAHQRLRGIHHFYIATAARDALLASADELVQLWNEGVNKEGNDMLANRFFGHPRDAHTVIEGILANRSATMALFLIPSPEVAAPPFATETVDAIESSHAGLRYGEEDRLLMQANYERMRELMPVIRIELRGTLSQEHGIVLGQLWQDLTVCYAKLQGIDPGSNPEVRFVRDRSDEILAKRC